MAAEWSIPVGILVYLVAIVFAVIFYLKYKKVFLVVFAGSIATYVFAVFYTWDVFDLNKNWILLMLIVSTVLMIFLGKYFSKIELKPSRVHTSLKEKKK